MSFLFERVHWKCITINENRFTPKHITVKFQDTWVWENMFKVYYDKRNYKKKNSLPQNFWKSELHLTKTATLEAGGQRMFQNMGRDGRSHNTTMWLVESVEEAPEGWLGSYRRQPKGLEGWDTSVVRGSPREVWGLNPKLGSPAHGTRTGKGTEIT